MNTFWRYFLHFTSIPLILSIIMGALAFFDSGIKINGKVVLLFIVAIFVFSLPMTTFYFKYAVDNETISINSDNPEYLLQTIDTTIKTKFNKSDKTLKTNTNGEKIYIYNNKNAYAKWLTNHVSVTVKGNQVVIEGPKLHIKFLSNMKNQTSFES
jgi:hypothetical protein